MSGPKAHELRAQIDALDGQLRRLVRTEQRLFVSQRALSRQLDRFDALNRFALALGPAPSAARIFELAADLVFKLFPLDQCAAFLVRDPQETQVVLVRSAPGRAAASEARFAQAKATVLDTPPWSPLPMIIGGLPHTSTAHRLAPLAAFACELFAPVPDEDDARLTVIVPIGDGVGGALGYLVFRRIGSALSYHEELPTERDIAFLQLLSQQVGAALTHGTLVADLKRSYELLEAAQRDLVERERLAAIGELAAVVAHEVRNPVAVIYNSLSALGRLVQPRGEIGALLAIVQDEARRLNQIVRDLLEFARPNPPRRVAESLDAVVREAIDGVRAAIDLPGSRVSLRRVSPEERVLAIDSRMIRQVVTNLVMNACQASADSQPVVVELSDERIGGVLFARIDVVDRGVGIEASVQEKVFDPFFTTKATGTGLGLAVVKKLVALHGGTIAISSTRGKGSTFTVRLPSGP